MKVSEMITKLEKIQKEHGDLELYCVDDCRIYECNSNYSATVKKLYYQKWEDTEYMRDVLADDDVNIKDEDLDDVDLTKPIIKAVII